MRFRQRLKRLECVSPGHYDSLSLIAITGAQEQDANRNSFFFYCLDQRCPEQQHAPLPNETYDEAIERITTLHEGIEPK